MYQIERADRTHGGVMEQKAIYIEDDYGKAELEYLMFPALAQTEMIEHLFTTRLGGVSTGVCSTMNISYERGDDATNVLHNYERIAKVLGCTTDCMVASRQTHATNIRRVTQADAGKGVTKERDYDETDGLITNERGIALVTAYADCVPLYFADPVHEAIGLAHSGWRGTVNQMGACMVRAMQEQFGSNPEHLLAAIGPSICQDCYEVSEEVAEAFKELENSSADILAEIRESGCLATTKENTCKILLPGKQEGKYQLNLWLANTVILRHAGIPLKNISITDICTCHNPKYLFSHRASYEKRGNLGAFLMLKEK